MTAALWLKIVMKDLCGIEAKDNVWYNGRTKELSRDDALGLDKDPPPGVERQWLEEGQFMDTMLESGQVDAAFIMPPAEIEAIGGTGEGYTRIMERWGGTELEGNARIRQLFPDQGKAVILRISPEVRTPPPAKPPLGHTEQGAEGQSLGSQISFRRL